MRRFLPEIFFALLLFCFQTPIAKADVIFVNVNLNYDEQEAARRGAEMNHERFIAIPDLTPDQWKSINTARRADGIDNDLEVVPDAILKNLRPLTKDGTFDVPTAIDSVLKREDDEHRQVLSFVMSSHHVGDYYGTLGKIEDLSLYTLLKNHPSARDHLQAFYGWGCYTAQADNALLIHRVLPDLPILAGWDGEAPGQGRQADTAMLTFLITHQNQAIRNGTKTRLKAFFESIPDVGRTLGTTNLGVAVCGHMQTTHHTMDLNDKKDFCSSDALSMVTRAQSAYDNYNAGTLDVPEDLNHSDLRTYYDIYRAYNVCFAGSFDTRPTIGQIVHLIHFKNSMKNFAVLYADDWKRLTDLIGSKKNALKNAGLDFPVIPDLSSSKTTRKQVLDLITDLQSWDSGSANDVFSSQSDRVLIGIMSARMSILLLNSQCVPDSWNDAPEGGHAEAPSRHCLLYPQ